MATIEELAVNGIHKMSLSRESMDQIVTTAVEVKEPLGHLSGQVENMEGILGYCGSDKLVALNAAIEAAPAGEHGRGFAVAAVYSDQIRPLSRRKRATFTGK